MKIPSQYLPLMPYLILKDSKGFLQFMKQVFGATEQQITWAENQTVMHGELRINDAVLMFGNSSEQWKEKTSGMYIYVKSTDETFDKAIANGATEIMKPVNQHYGRTAGFDDPFGNQWWVVESGE